MAVLPAGTRRRLMKHPLGWLAAGFGAGFSPREHAGTYRVQPEAPA